MSSEDQKSKNFSEGVKGTKAKNKNLIFDGLLAAGKIFRGKYFPRLFEFVRPKEGVPGKREILFLG